MQIVYVDGVFDLFHRGHIELFRKARQFGDHLVVGILDGKDVSCYKPEPFFTLEDRTLIVKECRLVDEVISPAPLRPGEEFLKAREISAVVHGDDNQFSEYYEAAIKLGIMRYVPYFSGVSSSSIVAAVASRARKND